MVIGSSTPYLPINALFFFFFSFCLKESPFRTKFPVSAWQDLGRLVGHALKWHWCSTMWRRQWDPFSEHLLWVYSVLFWACIFWSIHFCLGYKRYPTPHSRYWLGLLILQNTMQEFGEPWYQMATCLTTIRETRTDRGCNITSGRKWKIKAQST